MLQIPPFYRGGAKADAGADPLMIHDFKRLSRALFMKKKVVEVNLEDEDFRILLRKMVELSEPMDSVKTLDGKIMNFENFLSLSKCEEIHEVFRKQIFTPANFFLFPRTIDGCVYSDCAFSCAAEMREQRRVRYDLAVIDKENLGYLTEMQLVQYFDQFMREVPDDHLDFYIAVVVRKFIFFLERDKKVSIRDFMASPILYEFKQREKVPDNWFSSRNIYRLYNTFLELDEDRNMFLNRTEFAKFRLDQSTLPRITPLVVNRIFQTKIMKTDDNPQGELDFRNFLDFVLAFQSKSHPASLKYFWSLFDICEVGYLTGLDIRELVREVFDTLTEETIRQYTGGDINVDDVKNEVFDMVNSSSSAYISFDDLIKCGHGSTIVALLTDPSGFLMYEQREWLLQSQKEPPPEDEDEEYAQASKKLFGAQPLNAEDSGVGSDEDEASNRNHHDPPEDYV